MRDKIVFFILGAALATIAYLVGDLETLTAENKITELDQLHVKRLLVTESMAVGDVGKKFVLITANNKSATISLSGGTASENFDDFMNKTDNAPILSLMVKDSAALIKTESHSKRPEATCILGVINAEGKKYESSLIIQDLDGTNSAFSD